MIPKIFFLTEQRRIYVKYTTKEEFWQIRNILKKYGFDFSLVEDIFQKEYHKIIEQRKQEEKEIIEKNKIYKDFTSWKQLKNIMLSEKNFLINKKL